MTHATYVDLQGFKTISNEFIVKEAAILLNGNELLHWIFEPPFGLHRLTSSEKRQVQWLVKKHHGINWQDGYVPYGKARNCLTQALERSQTIIVKGSEKKEWLWKLTGIEALDVETDLEVDVPRLSRLQQGSHRCAFHDGVCILENVLKLCI